MKNFTQDFTIQYTYPVCFTQGLFSLDNALLEKHILVDEGCGPRKVQVFAEKSVVKAHSQLEEEIGKWFAERPQFLLTSAIRTYEGGEQIKNSFAIVEQMMQDMLAASICRHSYILIIGGGAFLDACSFAASIFHRGIRYIRIPTTVLAQDDSAIGVKCGINFLGVKNLVGSFGTPEAVINDEQLLQTLPKRDVIAGLAEAVKVSLIKDEGFYQEIRSNAKRIAALDWEVIHPVIRRSCLLHGQHICGSGDPFEKGSSRPLDFGHWSAHFLERMTNYSLRHGEAVAIGMAIDLLIAVRLGRISEEVALDVLQTLRVLGFELFHEKLAEHDEHGHLLIVQGLKEFQEHLGGQLTLPMPERIGLMSDIHQLNEVDVEAAVKYLEQNFQ